MHKFCIHFFILSNKPIHSSLCEAWMYLYNEVIITGGNLIQYQTETLSMHK